MLSSCSECWNNTCTCGHEYKNYTDQERIEVALAAMRDAESDHLKIIRAFLIRTIVHGVGCKGCGHRRCEATREPQNFCTHVASKDRTEDVSISDVTLKANMAPLWCPLWGRRENEINKP